MKKEKLKKISFREMRNAKFRISFFLFAITLFILRKIRKNLTSKQRLIKKMQFISKINI